MVHLKGSGEIMLTKSSDKEVKKNCNKLKPIVDTVILLGRFGLPFRGHRGDSVFLKTTDQPTTYHRPPTNRPTNPPPTKWIDHRPTDHRPIRNLKTRNYITNLKCITDKNVRLCYECI